MNPIFLFLLLFISLTASSQTYYIVRHAEKAQPLPAGPSDDPPLSRKGEQRAQHLKELLENKNIKYIFSTNYIRTLSTAKPLSQAIHVAVKTYVNVDSAFIKKIKALKKNVLIVGHSNTIDNIANALTNVISVRGDIADSVYDNLFVVQYIGRKIKFEAKKY